MCQYTKQTDGQIWQGNRRSLGYWVKGIRLVSDQKKSATESSQIDFVRSESEGKLKLKVKVIIIDQTSCLHARYSVPQTYSHL